MTGEGGGGEEVAEGLADGLQAGRNAERRIARRQGVVWSEGRWGKKGIMSKYVLGSEKNREQSS